MVLARALRERSLGGPLGGSNELYPTGDTLIPLCFTASRAAKVVQLVNSEFCAFVFQI